MLIKAAGGASLRLPVVWAGFEVGSGEHGVTTGSVTPGHHDAPCLLTWTCTLPGRTQHTPAALEEGGGDGALMGYSQNDCHQWGPAV